MSADPSTKARLDQVADACLAYLIANPEELAGFMAAAGYTPQTLRPAIATNTFKRGLLDYFVTNEAALLAMCANANLDPAAVTRLWQNFNQQD